MYIFRHNPAGSRLERGITMKSINRRRILPGALIVCALFFVLTMLLVTVTARGVVKSREITVMPGQTITADNANHRSVSRLYYPKLALAENETTVFPVRVNSPGTLEIGTYVNGKAGLGAALYRYKPLSSNGRLKGRRVQKHTNGNIHSSTMCFTIGEAGTYYLKLRAGSALVHRNYYFYANYVQFGSRITAGKQCFGANYSGKSTSYYKLTAPSDGLLTVDVQDVGVPKASFRVRLVTPKNAYLTNYETLRTARPRTYVGVTKGTYYLAVKTSDPLYTVKVRFSPRKAARNNVITLASGQISSGLIPASSGKYCRYLLDIAAPQEVSLRFTSRAGIGGKSGGIAIGECTKDGKIQKTHILNRNRSSITLHFRSGNSSLMPPGKYYILVMASGRGSGAFRVDRLK